MDITGYRCIVCGKWHSIKRGKKFMEHYALNKKHYGFAQQLFDK